MKLRVNGDPHILFNSQTVLEFLQQHELENQRVAIELNGVILESSEFAEHSLADGDVLEIVRFVGGG